ncbi:MAG TPA: SRPBCC family protein [Terriglobales bacterium]|nr:SRPBCC family protein [Terriglobales bacterium]
MAKFPTTAEKSVTVKAPLEQVYALIWDVVSSARCIPGIDSCEPAGDDVYSFVMKERSAGPVSMVVRYHARFEGNGSDTIRFRNSGGEGENTEVDGTFKLKPTASGGTKITLKQTVSPESPVPRLLQGFLSSYVEKEAAQVIAEYLHNLKLRIEAEGR